MIRGWRDLDSATQRRIRAADPAALRRYVEGLGESYGIGIRYTSNRREWWAKIRSRNVSIPAPYDLITLAICLHEVAHVINGECPNTGQHRRTEDGCKECELRSDHTVDARLMPLTLSQHAKLAECLDTYSGVPAPASVGRSVDAFTNRNNWLRNKLNTAKLDVLQQELEHDYTRFGIATSATRAARLERLQREHEQQRRRYA